MKILVIDDDLTVCKSCQKIVKKAGYEVDYSLSGHEALQMMEKTAYDLVFTDLKMTEMGGMEVLRFIKTKDPDIVVVVITGYATVASAVETMKTGAFDYLPKPFTPAEFRAVLSKAVEERKATLKDRELATQRTITSGFQEIVSESPKMETVFNMIKKVAPTDSNVLIVGESGTGKELIAQAIHKLSKRKARKFFAVDCAALSGTLLESELFGHVKGAFTGAIHNKPGVFEVANHGTVFLDEICNINMEVQGKLLRFLQEREFLPVGATQTKSVDVRLVFATNKDLKEMVAHRTLREDFYYRIFVYPISVPPLRDRKSDIPLLAYHFLKRYSESFGKSLRSISRDAMKALCEYEWPGNVRQLENVIQAAVIASDTNILTYKDLPEFRDPQKVPYVLPRTNIELKRLKKELRLKTVEKVERDFLIHALKRNDWNVTRAAKDVGMQRTNFQGLMRKHGIGARDVKL
ncbi:MAG: sigma-54-dependent Fis family transcriptional regulator [Deltaproteobacteria bacterium]|nr:sigma-54-dependent Fis family transcriptional regulator [Deltaproteobacteria bacterium]MBW2073399.1 sigma-54-dependent Fis family transcriptional regulator [Deltaproteobacteria bacterium]RLB83956.1 MAG: sigma-54-dependent Fis family transcriptional regulator [Deltaproteobacteria bacterium]